MSRHEASGVVRRYAHMAKPQGDPPTFNPRFPDMYRAVHDRPHQPVQPKHLDWLSRYRKEHIR